MQTSSGIKMLFAAFTTFFSSKGLDKTLKMMYTITGTVIKVKKIYFSV